MLVRWRNEHQPASESVNAYDLLEKKFDTLRIQNSRTGCYKRPDTYGMIHTNKRPTITMVVVAKD